MSSDFDSLKSLPFERKLELLDEVWTAVAEDDAFSDIPAWHLELLEERIAEHERDPSKVISWEDLRRKICGPGREIPNVII